MIYIRRIYLQDKEACVDDAWVDKDSTELSTLKQLICFLKEKVVSIEHHHPLILHQLPNVKLIQRQLEPLVKIILMFIWIVHIFHSHHFRTVFFRTWMTQYPQIRIMLSSQNQSFICEYASEPSPKGQHFMLEMVYTNQLRYLQDLPPEICLISSTSFNRQ